MPDPDYEVPIGLFEDVEDLKATLARQQAELAAQSQQLASLLRALGPGQTTAGHGTDDEDRDDEDGQEDEDAQYPPFLLLLEPPQYDQELRALVEWVECVLVPGYLGEPSADARWCPRWFDHTVALARLHACWLAWQELTDPATCGYLGPSTWHRDHLDPCIQQLRAPNGPLSGCTKGEHQIAHRMPSIVPSAWKQTTT